MVAPLVAAIPAVLEIGARLIDKIFPDPAVAEEHKIRLLDLAQQGQLAELQAAVDAAVAQSEVNKAEATSGDKYAARWRPTVGYILAAVLAYTYVLGPLLTGFAALAWPDVRVPQLALDDRLWEVTFGMLGLAGWRSWEKVSGVGSGNGR